MPRSRTALLATLALTIAAPTGARGDDTEGKLDFPAFAETYIEEHSLDPNALTFEDMIAGDDFLRCELVAFDLRIPVDALGNADVVDNLKEAVQALLDAQETWFTWSTVQPPSKTTESHWKELRKWVKSWSHRKLGKCVGGGTSLAEQLEAKDKVLEALRDLGELARPDEDTIKAVGALNVTVVAPTRRHFLQIAAMGGLLDPREQKALWTDKLVNQSAAWFKWIQILVLEDGPWPVSYEQPFTGSPKNSFDPTAMAQYIADRAGVAMLRREFWRHPTLFFEEALGTNIVIAVAGKNGQFTQGEWSMSWSQAGASTEPYTRFVPGGNPAGGVLPPRKAIPGPKTYSFSYNGVEISKYRTNLGVDFFIDVLKKGQEDGAKLAAKDRDNERRKDKTAHFEIYSQELHESTYVTAPFLGDAAEGKALPPDEYLDAYEDFFRAYRSGFVEWLRRHGADKEGVSEELFAKLIELHSNRTRGTSISASVEAVYPIPLSSTDPEVDTLERRYLAWIEKGG